MNQIISMTRPARQFSAGLLVALVSLALPVITKAQIVAIPAAGSAPIIDGNLDASWSGISGNGINTISGTVSSTSDLSGSWKAQWDASNLYFLAEVTDDDKRNDSTDVWADDSVELYLDGANDKATSYDSNDRQYIFGWGDASAVEGGGRNVTGVTFAKADPTSTTYRIEARVPWSAVGVTVSAGQSIGIEAHVSDDDGGGGREGKRMWSSITDTAWQNPSVFGTATLQGGSQPGGSGTITRDVWTGISGNSVSLIPTGTTPSSTGTLTSFEAPTNAADNYGQRVRGYLTAPQTGSYTFWIAADDNCELWLSTNDQPASKVRIAYHTSWTASREWNKFTTQKSAAISLAAGTRYYIEVLQKEGTGGDNLAVGWAKPGQSTTAPSEVIPGAQLSPWDGSTPQPPAAPTGLTATAGDGQVALSWNASTGATSYNVKRSTTSGSGYSTVVSPTTTSYTNTGLTNGTTYYYVVSAVNSAGESGNSSQVSATPTAPAGTGNTHAGTWAVKGVFGSTATWKNLQQWAGVASNSTYAASFWMKGSGKVTLILQYGGPDYAEITRQTFTATSSWTQYSIPSVATTGHSQILYRLVDSGGVAGTVYIDDCFLGVSGGTNTLGNPGFESGNAVWSNDAGSPFTILQPGGGSPPAAPTGLTATPGNAQVALSWSAVSGATSYNVKRSTTSGSGYSTINSPTTTSYTNTGLTNGTTYYYVVSAVNSNGESANSSQVSATPTAPPSGDGSPYGGTARAVPGTIQSEDYNTGGEGIAYSDTDTTNTGVAYRTSEGVDIEATTDTGGGYNVGWTANTEYLKYTVNVGSAGNYDIRIRHAGTGTGSIRIEFGGVDKTGNVTLNATGGWQTWTDTTVPGVSLSAGQQVMRVVLLSGGFNLNYVAISTAGSNPRPSFSAHVKVCQLGYLPDETKYAMLTFAPSGPVVVRRSSDNAAVLSVNAGAAVSDADSGDTIRLVDFSSVSTAGTYYLDAPGVGASYDFRIGSDVFTGAYRAALRSFYGQRCGMAVNMGPDYPSYSYTACHTASSQYHSSTGRTGSKSSTRGWHDAGDYGKYMINSGITTGTLLWTYELYSGKIGNINLNIPESTNSIPDILDEIKWNLDWMLTMQDTDGGVYHKMTSANFPGFIMPQDDSSTLYIVGTGSSPWKCTAASADFAAVMAIASRLFRPYNATLADQYLAAARSAYTWAGNNPNSNFTANPSGINTGGYNDNDPSDERLWAAAELFRTTGESQYNTYFLNNYGNWNPTLVAWAPQNWPDVNNLAMYTYALSGRSNADATAVNRIKADAVTAADGIVSRARSKGYRVPLASGEYYWGSNSVAANYAIMCLIANRFTPKADYTNTAQDVMHYLFGRNTFNTSFVTQVGDKWPMNPHHRPSGADSNTQPWPGLLVGGPNAEGGGTPPARRWFDDQNSYTTNENAINWNAGLVFLLAEAMP